MADEWLVATFVLTLALKRSKAARVMPGDLVDVSPCLLLLLAVTVVFALLLTL